MDDRQDPAAFDAVAGNFSPAIAALANGARSLVLDVLPAAYEIVWQQQKNTGYGTGPKKQSEHFCWIAPATKHVTLGFNYGAELSDPDGLLEGTGKLFRHVKIASEADLRRPALRRLIEQATRHRVPPPAPARAKKSVRT